MNFANFELMINLNFQFNYFFLSILYYFIILVKDFINLNFIFVIKNLNSIKFFPIPNFIEILIATLFFIQIKLSIYSIFIIILLLFFRLNLIILRFFG